MVRVVRVDFADVIEPKSGFGRVAEFDARWPVQVEATDVLALDPSPHRDEPVSYLQRQARRPGHRLHRPVLVEPFICRLVDDLAVAVPSWLAVFVEHGLSRQPRVDVLGGPAVPPSPAYLRDSPLSHPRNY